MDEASPLLGEGEGFLSLEAILWCFLANNLNKLAKKRRGGGGSRRRREEEETEKQGEEDEEEGQTTTIRRGERRKKTRMGEGRQYVHDIRNFSS